MGFSQGPCSVSSYCRIPDSCPFTVAEVRSRAQRALEWRFYEKDSTVFRQGDEARGIFVIQSGWVALFADDAARKRVPVGIRGPGSILGLCETVGSSTYLTTARTREETEFEFLHLTQLMTLLEQSATFRTQVMKTVAGESRQIIDEVLDVGRLPADQKLWKILVNLAKSSACHTGSAGGARFTISVTHLSEQIGCSRQWTSGLLSALERSGALRRDNGWIILPDNGSFPRLPHKQARRRRRPSP